MFDELLGQVLVVATQLLSVGSVAVGYYDSVVCDTDVAFNRKEQISGQMIGILLGVRLPQPTAKLVDGCLGNQGHDHLPVTLDAPEPRWLPGKLVRDQRGGMTITPDEKTCVKADGRVTCKQRVTAEQTDCQSGGAFLPLQIAQKSVVDRSTNSPSEQVIMSSPVIRPCFRLRAPVTWSSPRFENSITSKIGKMYGPLYGPLGCRAISGGPNCHFGCNREAA